MYKVKYYASYQYDSLKPDTSTACMKKIANDYDLEMIIAETILLIADLHLAGALVCEYDAEQEVIYLDSQPMKVETGIFNEKRLYTIDPNGTVRELERVQSAATVSPEKTTVDSG